MTLKRAHVKGSVSLEAAIIVPVILVMIFMIVGAFAFVTQSGDFELKGNRKMIGVEEPYHPLQFFLHLNGKAERENREIVVPFWGEQTLQHCKVAYKQTLYDVVYGSLMLKAMNPSKREGEVHENKVKE